MFVLSFFGAYIDPNAERVRYIEQTQSTDENIGVHPILGEKSRAGALQRIGIGSAAGRALNGASDGERSSRTSHGR